MERAVDRAVECTHCRVVMSSWTVPRSTVRYWQCPRCRRRFSSPYREVLRQPPPARPGQPAAAPPPSPLPGEDVRWSQLKRRAASWFARLEREARAAPAAPRRLSVEAVAAAAARGR